MRNNKFSSSDLFKIIVKCTPLVKSVFLIPIFFLIVLSCKTDQTSNDTIPDSNLHPKLYMTRESQEILKSKMTNQDYAPLLARLRIIADKYVQSGPPAYKPGSGYDEQLWQREVGNAIPELAMAYCMTGVKKYFDSARDYMLASDSYPTWGIGDIDNTDLATGHQLYGMALGYDWLYADLDSASRHTIRDCLLRRGGRLYDLLSEGKVWWRNSYVHNHQHVNLTGLMTAGLALYGESKEVDKWIHICQQKLNRAISSLPPDGGCLEGIPYSEYSIEYLMKFMTLSNELSDNNLFKDDLFFKNLTSFRLYAMIPKNFWEASKSTLMSLGDGPRHDWYGPDYLLRKLASEYNDGYAQWLANEMDLQGYSSPQAFFLNLLWINPEIQPLPPNNLSTFKHFDDLDIVYMRSGWGGEESLSMFKCGPWIGHRAASEYTYDPYGGHTHPDVGTFQIFSHGDWLITYPGYSWKRTIYQNTLVVNEKGQIGEGRWFNGNQYVQVPEQPVIVFSRSEEDYDYVIGNGTPAYPLSTNLTSYYRHILYLKPDCWVIADEVTANSPSSFDFYYHSDFPFISYNTNQYRVEGTRGSMNATVLKPGDADKETYLQEIEGTGGGVANRLNVLKVGSKDKTSDLFITVFDTYNTGESSIIQSSIATSENLEYLLLNSKNGTKRFKIEVNRPDKSTPLFIEVK